MTNNLFRKQFAKVDSSDPDACWLWPGQVNNWGYGVAVHFSGQGKEAVHRMFYEELTGTRLPKRGESDMTLDHLCRNRTCCNPSHMELVTRGENTRRGAKTRVYKRADFCKHGHPYSGANLYVDPSGKHHCRQCGLRRWREWSDRQVTKFHEPTRVSP